MRFIDLMDCRPETLWATKACEKASLIVLGGGGLLDLPKFGDPVSHVVRTWGEKVVVWGAGGNRHKQKPFESDLTGVRLVGRRDYSPILEPESPWVPCASCLNPELHELLKNKSRFSPKGIGLFENNAGKKVARVGDCGRPDVRRFGNRDTSLREILEFILSVEVLVTSSFHGLYWATLCQVPAIGIPGTSKFHTLKHRQVLSSADAWVDSLKDVTVYPKALDECVEANLSFMAKVNETFPESRLAWPHRAPRRRDLALKFAHETARRLRKRLPF